MRTTHKLLMLLTIVVVALSACSTLRTASDYDKKVSFNNYKTYNFYDKGIARLKLNDLDKRRMLSAIDAEMTTKGFTKTENPDLLVNLVVVARERVDAYGSGFYGPGWGWGWGWRSPFWGGGANYVDQYMEGTIIIDFLDPKTKTLVWHGRGSGFNLDNFRKREERMNTGVKEILGQYPPNASTNN